MVTMPKHVGVKELKNILAVNCAFVINIKPLMYQNACNELYIMHKTQNCTVRSS